MITLEKIREIVSQDKDTKHLKSLNQIDLNVAYQYILTRDQNLMPGYVPVLITKPYLSIEYRQTKEKLAADRSRQLTAKLSTFESEIFIQSATLADFRINDEERENAALKVQEFLNNFPKTYIKGFYLSGPYGSGKSYLLSALAAELLRRGSEVIFTFVPDLIRSLKADISTGKLEYRINLLKRADVLILDDFGGENITPWFRDEILLPIIQYRLSASLPVFISSNITRGQLPESLKGNNPDADMFKVARLVKRINDLTIPITLSKSFKTNQK